MHIHGSQTNLNPVNAYSAAADKAAAAQHAAYLRRKLTRNAQNIEGAPPPAEGVMIGQWVDSRHSQVESQDQYRTSVSGKDPDFG